MDRRAPKNSEDDSILHEAVEWLLRWEDHKRPAAAREQARWFRWLRRSPRHVHTYFEVSDLYERLGKMDADRRIDVDDWIASRRAPVTRLGSSEVSTASASGTAGTRVWAAAATLAVFGIGLVIWAWLNLASSERYRTDVGEQRIFKLADGSVVNLNTRSKLVTHFSKNQRLVDLEGEGLFNVAHDGKRPFYVRTKLATVRAVGTTFNVREQPAATRVLVVEGAVQVSADRAASRFHAAAPTLRLSAGEGANIDSFRVAKRLVVNLESEIAWRHQKLVFEDASLAEVAEEFNRYNQSQIRLKSAKLSSERLSGTFDAMRPQSLLLFLERDPRILVEASGNDFVVQTRDSR